MEANNMAEMREALGMMISLFDKGVICTSYANSAEEMEQIEELYRKSKAALSAPPRNCDVGTADEQAERFTTFCNSYWNINKFNGNCKGCPVKDRNAACEFAWAQMPYEADASFTKPGENVNSGSAIDMEVNKAKEGDAE